MNLDQIETKCFILALFIRDDGERFLLGSRAYEFKDSQLHFVANTYQNDVVEVQGNDGIMLAGQVRRAVAQGFNGYIGDSSVDRATIEQYRQAFLKFFRKNHYYKVVYIFPDGSAIQRRQGFIVEAPEAKELYQLFPEYHISMNFEDINYYNYDEDAEGQEIYGESATLKIDTSASGGLIWVEEAQVTISGEGSNFTLSGTNPGASVENVQLKGDASQQSYTGKNLLSIGYATGSNNGINWERDGNSITVTGTSSNTEAYRWMDSGSTVALASVIPAGTYTLSRTTTNAGENQSLNFQFRDSSNTTIVSNIRLGSSTASRTITLARDAYYFRVAIEGIVQNVPVDIYYNGIQLEAGSTPTSFEPYVGGIPSPNPDYPQAVQTVTGRQVVTITDGGSESQEYEVNLGKNLLDSSSFTAAYINSGGGINADSGAHNALFDYIEVNPSTQYVLSSKTSCRISFAFYDSSKTFISRDPQTSGGQTSRSTTTPSNCWYVRVWVYRQDPAWDQTAIDQAELQFEKGSTASTYAEYFTPIELCKLGDYQDYIYKSGSDWYIHKAIEKVILDGSETNWVTNIDSGRRQFYRVLDVPHNPTSNIRNLAKSDRFISGSAGNSFFLANTNTGVVFRQPESNGVLVASTVAEWQTWLSSNNVSVYYVRATIADTQITNAALIAQLNALAGATTYNGHTIFTVTSAGKLGILSLSSEAINGGGVVWDNYGAEWEEGTGGGPTMISVDSIDNVYPVWELTGPAVDPQISVLTTNTTLSYTGSITASQTLTVDMFNKTATLNGTSVVGNISGDWVYLAPGTNRVTYTTTNADAPDSTIWWQEIVG